MSAAAKPLVLHEDRLLPADPVQRAIARRLYAQVAALPIVSPHGHTDPAWFATDAPFANATELLLLPDHYLFRMLYSQGVSLDALVTAAHNGSTMWPATSGSEGVASSPSRKRTKSST